MLKGIRKLTEVEKLIRYNTLTELRSKYQGTGHQHITMAASLTAPAATPLVCNYSTSLYRPESDTFTNGYSIYIAPYVINTENPTAAKSPAKISKEKYAAATEVIPTA